VRERGEGVDGWGERRVCRGMTEKGERRRKRKEGGDTKAVT
jgi:hypothetical protein